MAGGSTARAVTVYEMRLSVIAVICFVTVLGLYVYEDIPVAAAVSGKRC